MPPAVKAPRRRTDAPRHGHELASRLVEEGARILATEGIGALTLRRLATAGGTSTMAVYTLFGDKHRLLQAMHDEGFARLGAAMAAAHNDADDELTALVRLGEAYRASAVADPHLYMLMFGGTAPGFVPDPQSQAAADATFQPLVAAVQRCLDAGVLVGGSAQQIATFLWSVSHGVVSLELTGKLVAATGDAETAYREAMVFSAMPFLPQTGSSS